MIYTNNPPSQVLVCCWHLMTWHGSNGLQLSDGLQPKRASRSSRAHQVHPYPSPRSSPLHPPPESSPWHDGGYQGERSSMHQEGEEGMSTKLSIGTFLIPATRGAAKSRVRETAEVAFKGLRRRRRLRVGVVYLPSFDTEPTSSGISASGRSSMSDRLRVFAIVRCNLAANFSGSSTLSRQMTFDMEQTKTLMEDNVRGGATSMMVVVSR